MSIFYSILETFIILWASYLMVSLAGLYNEKSGITNIGLNGIMVMGAMTYAVVMTSPSIRNALGAFTPFLGIILGAIVGMFFSWLFGVVTITFYADQVIAGTAINIITAAVSVLFIQLVFGQDFLSWSFDNPINNFPINIVYLSFLVLAIIVILISIFVINKTKFGLHLKASGENPYALETSGVSVTRVRYIAVLISGLLAGAAGAIAMPGFSKTFNGTINGMGYIALAILIFGQWKIIGITIGSFIIAILMALGSYWEALGTVANIIPVELIRMLPFIMPIVIMIFVKSSNSPKMIGIPFRKDERV